MKMPCLDTSWMMSTKKAFKKRELKKAGFKEKGQRRIWIKHLLVRRPVLEFPPPPGPLPCVGRGSEDSEDMGGWRTGGGGQQEQGLPLVQQPRRATRLVVHGVQPEQRTVQNNTLCPAVQTFGLL